MSEMHREHPDVVEQINISMEKTAQFLSKEHENPFFNHIPITKFMFDLSFSLSVSILVSYVPTKEIALKVLKDAYENAVKEVRKTWTDHSQ